MSLLQTSLYLFLGYVVWFSLNKLKEYVRYRQIAATLPTLRDRKPIIGHLGKLFGKSPEDFFVEIRKWNKEHFPVFKVHLAEFVGILVNGPDVMEKILSSTKNNKKNEAYKFLHGWLEQGLLTSTGPKYQTRRKILTPTFHFNILLQFITIFNDETTALLSQLNELTSKNPVIDVVPLITDLTLLTINETSMGVKLNFNTKEGAQYKHDVCAISSAILLRFTKPWLYYDIFYYLTPSGRYYKNLANSLHRFTEKIIKEREQDFKPFNEPSDENDDSYKGRKKLVFLDLLINAKLKYGLIDDDGIREEVTTFLFEGHDTTGMNLSYTLMLLANNPIEQEKVYEELIQVVGNDPGTNPTYNQLQELQYTDRCIKESLRLYPSVPFIGRTAEDEIVTEHGTIPKGAPLFLLIYDMHRHPSLWPDPDKFDPDRFLPENSVGRHPYAYIPFSAGPRNCIGQRFAILEAKSVLCGILRKFKLEAVDTPDSLVLIQDIILRPITGVRVRFVAREN